MMMMMIDSNVAIYKYIIGHFELDEVWIEDVGMLHFLVRRRWAVKFDLGLSRIQPRLKKVVHFVRASNSRGGKLFPLFLCLENLVRARPANHQSPMTTTFLISCHYNAYPKQTPFLTMTKSNNTNDSGSVDFRQLLNEETRVLTNLCQKWEDQLQQQEDKEGHSDESHTSSPSADAIRGVVGQCKMLLHTSKGRLAQFRNLIQQSERPQTRSQTAKGVQSISTEDLQGFWDMISFQIDDVKRDFQRLEEEHKQKEHDSADDNGEVAAALVNGFEDLQIREDKKVDDVGTATTTAAMNKVTKPTKPSWNNRNKSGRPTSSSSSTSTKKATTSSSSSNNKKAAAGSGNIRDFIAQKRLEAQKKKTESNDKGDGAGFLVM